MIKHIIFFFIISLNFNFAFSRNTGETEITTEDGIEVFQEEKYYLLKKNVEIFSDDFELRGQLVKIYFDKDLYDIQRLVATKDVEFSSDIYGIKGSGENLEFNINNEKITVKGKDSKLFLETTEMFSDEIIIVNNIGGSFSITGSKSKLISENLYITGSKINGTFEIIEGNRDITNLKVEDEIGLHIITNKTEMFSKKAIYDRKKSIIELFENVKIKRGNEVIVGDYGILDTNKNSYKVSSKNSNKVKAVITNSE